MARMLKVVSPYKNVLGPPSQKKIEAIAIFNIVPNPIKILCTKNRSSIFPPNLLSLGSDNILGNMIPVAKLNKIIEITLTKYNECIYPYNKARGEKIKQSIAIIIPTNFDHLKIFTENKPIIPLTLIAISSGRGNVVPPWYRIKGVLNENEDVKLIIRNVSRQREIYFLSKIDVQSIFIISLFVVSLFLLFNIPGTQRGIISKAAR